MMKSKVTSVLLSLVIAFGLWLYVVTNVSQEADYTIYNVPVVMEGETVLTERNLMITSVSADDVDLTLSGNRSDLAKVNSSNMILKVNLTEIYEPQEKKAPTLAVSETSHQAKIPPMTRKNRFFIVFLSICIESLLTSSLYSL